MISAAFSAIPYTALLGCALSCIGMIDASTTRRFVVSYTFRCASTTPGTITMSILNYLMKQDPPPRLRRIMAAVPIGCATDSKPATPGWTIHCFQSASEPPSPLSGTAASPGEISLADSKLWFDVSKPSEGRLLDDKVQEIEKSPKRGAGEGLAREPYACNLDGEVEVDAEIVHVDCG